jgi:DNA-directed RNA polymerase specialized sigma24 family protein
MTTDTVVAHGYTMRDLHKLAASACTYDRSMASDAGTRYNTAWSAIAEALCAADEPPAWHDLFTVGWRAIYNEVREMRHTYGFFEKDGSNGVASSPRFVQYWTQPPVRPDDGLTERLAVGQILATLTDTERDAVVALAVHDDYRRAAEALGISYTALTVRMSAARKRFRAHWYAPETAPAIKGTDRRVGSHGKPLATRCKNGKGTHEMTPENTYRRPSPKPGKRGERVCRACEAERSKARSERKRAGAAA